MKKNGISLIVLSITILVMAILAATAIISLEDSGIIGRAKGTTNKLNYTDEYTRLTVIKNGMLTDNLGSITLEEYINELDGKVIIESGRTNNADGSVIVTTKSGFEVLLSQNGDSDLNIKITDAEAGNNTNTSNIVSIEFDDLMNIPESFSNEAGETWQQLVSDGFSIMLLSELGSEKTHQFSAKGEYITSSLGAISPTPPGMTCTKVKLTDKYGDYTKYYILYDGTERCNILYGEK